LHHWRKTGRERYREQQEKDIGDIYCAKTSSQNSLFLGTSPDEPAGNASSSLLKTAEAGISIQKAVKIMAAQHVWRLP
jgi:hypothetical protein